MRACALALTVAFGGSAEAMRAQDFRTASASRQQRGEEDLAVSVQFAVGTLQLRPAPERVLYRMNLRYDARTFEPRSEYDTGDRRLRVGVEGLNVRGDRFPHRNLSEQRLELQLSPVVPTELELAFGAGQADVELGGLSLRDIQIKGGAAETVVRFSQPNRITCERLLFEVGAIDLKTERLGNARCRRIEFNGAAGDITLDLTGEWPSGEPAQVEIAVGLGSVRLRLPEAVGVAVGVDRFLTSFDQAGLQRRGNRYYSANYDRAGTRIELGVKAAMGSVEIEWVK